jgi:hypothetical protein
VGAPVESPIRGLFQNDNFDFPIVVRYFCLDFLDYVLHRWVGDDPSELVFDHRSSTLMSSNACFSLKNARL